MADGNQVGSGYIEITPEISKQGLGKAQRDIKEHLKEMGKAVDKEFSRQQQEVVGKFNKQMKAMQRGDTSGIFADIRAEMTAHQKLQKQIERSQSLELKRIEAIQKAEVSAHAMNKARTEAMAKVEAADQKRRLNDINSWYTKKQALDKADALEGQKAARAAAAEMDRMFKQSVMTGLGANPAATASQAGSSITRLKQLESAGQQASRVMSRAFDNTSHTLSQLSTRIGLASFQLQLLGGFATTFLTGPAALGFIAMGREGLKFAVAIDYARASMESLLPPATNVEKILADIRKMAIESPLFNTEDAISYAQKLAAVGVKGKDLYKSMQALSNIFLTQGVAGPERANLALMAYTQILSKGTIGMDDLRQQFAEHVPGGIKVFEEAAKVLGFKTLEGLRNSMKAGKTSAEELNQAFIKLGNSDKYLSGATKAAETLGGTWQAFQENIQATLGMAFDANRKEIIAAIKAIEPVVMAFINAVVKALPAMINWLNQAITTVRRIKAAYDSLNPAQQEMVKQLVLIGLLAGPAAIAIGIFGTALSAVANGASLAMKALSIIGGAATATIGWATAIGVALLALGAAMVYLYEKSEPFRKAFLQAMNTLKDAVVGLVLPAVDYLIKSVKQTLSMFEGMGLSVKDLAKVLYIFLIPIAAVAVSLMALTAILEGVQWVVLALATAFQVILWVLSAVVYVVEAVIWALSKLPGAAGDAFDGALSAVEGFRKGMQGLVDIAGLYNRMNGEQKGSTDGLKESMDNLDLTTTGLLGSFRGWNSITDSAIQKQMTLEEAITNARKAMDSQASAARGAQDASDQWNKSLIALKGSVDANKGSLNEKTKAGQANRDMLKQAAQASYELMLQDIRSGVPMQEAINRHKARTVELKKEFGQGKETQASAQKLIDTYGKVPKDVATLLKIMGYKDVAAKMQEILAAQKVAKNPNISYGEALRVERKAWDKAGAWATGGYIANGPGTTTSDSILAKLSKKEFVVNAKATKDVGPETLAYINKTGQLPLPAFAAGGPVQWPVTYDLSGTKFPEMLGGSSKGGGIGWARMMGILRQQFPGLAMISGYRPGAMTSTGNASYHGMGRAVDLPPRWDVFNWISQNYGRATKELIYTPAGGRQIKNGQNHVFSGGTIQKDHYDHVHWAYDNGGYIKPNQPFINKTGGNELALNAAQGMALEEKIKNSSQPVYVSVYVDGVRRDAEVVVDEKLNEVIQALGGV